MISQHPIFLNMALTQIFDTWYNVDGTLFDGTLVITPSNAGAGIVYADSQSIAPGSVTCQIQNGVVDLFLHANDIAQPTGTNYSVLVYAGRGKSWTEIWTVPTSTIPVALAAVRGLAQGLRRAAFFPPYMAWPLPAVSFGTASKIPMVLLYDETGNQTFGTITRNASTGDISVSWAVPQMGSAEVLLTPLQYAMPITSATSVTITTAQSGLSNLIGVVVLDEDGTYIAEGVSMIFSVIAASPVSNQATVGSEMGGYVPFGSNFSGAFQSVTVEFVQPQTGTVVLLGS